MADHAFVVGEGDRPRPVPDEGTLRPSARFDERSHDGRRPVPVDQTGMAVDNTGDNLVPPRDHAAHVDAPSGCRATLVVFIYTYSSSYITTLGATSLDCQLG